MRSAGRGAQFFVQSLVDLFSVRILSVVAPGALRRGVDDGLFFRGDLWERSVVSYSEGARAKIRRIGLHGRHDVPLLVAGTLVLASF